MEETWFSLYKALKAKDFDETIRLANILIENYFGPGKGHEFFDRLLNPEMLSLLSGVELDKCKAGDILMKEGERGNEMFIIISGLVDVRTTPPKNKGFVLPLPPVLINQLVAKLVQGNKVTIVKLGVGSVFGEISLLTPHPRTATVKATTDCAFIIINREIFYKIIEADPPLKDLFIDLIVERMRRSTEALKNAGKKVNTCVATAIYNKLKESADRTDHSMSDEISKVAANFHSAKYQSNISAHLSELDRLYNTRNFLEFFSTIGKISRAFLKEYGARILNRVVPVIEKTPIAHVLNIKPVEPVKVGPFDEHFLNTLQHTTLKHYKDKEAVFFAKEDSQNAYIVKDGIALASDDEGYPVATFSRGETFGEFAFIMNIPRTATVTAQGELTAYELKKEAIQLLIVQYPSIWYIINEHFTHNVEELVERIEATEKALWADLQNKLGGE